MGAEVADGLDGCIREVRRQVGAGADWIKVLIAHEFSFYHRPLSCNRTFQIYAGGICSCVYLTIADEIRLSRASEDGRRLTVAEFNININIQPPGVEGYDYDGP